MDKEELEQIAKNIAPVNANYESKALIEEDEDDGEGWLISYADMMTLIACFFILMTTFANYDPKTFEVVAKEIKKHFKGADLQVEEDLNTELITKLEAITQNKDLVKIKSMFNGIEIKFNAEYLYDTASDLLRDDVKEMVALMAEVIKDSEKNFLIEAHGHTDSRPVISKGFRDNWELSSARALSIIRVFEKIGFEKNRLIAIGYGDSRPEVKDKDEKGLYIEKNLKQNRRVILLVKNPSKEITLGLGNIVNQQALEGNTP